MSYLLIRQYLLFGFKRFYSKVIVVGKENLPSNDSAIIFAPNHLNAFMDALAILYIVSTNKIVVFLAKSDLFSSKSISYILNYAKILPAYRKVDGIENLSKNTEVFDACIDAMNRNQAVGIMPEGGQGEKHQIRPLVKGIFRIAFEAQKQFGDQKKVKIVPIGLDMGDLIKSSSHLIINIGKPIDVIDYIQDYNSNSSVTLNSLKRKLHQSLSDLTLDISSEEYYDTIKFISDIEGYKYISEKKDADITYKRFIHKQNTIKKLLQIQRDDPSKMKTINDEVVKFQKKMNELNLTPAVFSADVKSVLELIVGFPLFLFGFTTNFLPTFIPVWLRKLINIEYDGFYSSVQFSAGLITFPLFYSLQTMFVYKFILKNIWFALLFFILQYSLRKYSISWWKSCKKRNKRRLFEKERTTFESFEFNFLK